MRFEMQHGAAARGFEARFGQVAGQGLGGGRQALALDHGRRRRQGQCHQHGQHGQHHHQLQQGHAAAHVGQRFQQRALGPTLVKPWRTAIVSRRQALSAACWLPGTAVALACQPSASVASSATL